MAASSGVERAPSRWRHRVGSVVVSRWPGRPGTRRDGAGTSVLVDEPQSCRGVERRELPHIAAVLASAGTHDGGEAVGRLLRGIGLATSMATSTRRPRCCPLSLELLRAEGLLLPANLRTTASPDVGPGVRWAVGDRGLRSRVSIDVFPGPLRTEDRGVEALGPTPHDSVSVARLVCDRGIGAAPATRRWG
jgi:hypothetical protein